MSDRSDHLAKKHRLIKQLCRYKIMVRNAKQLLQQIQALEAENKEIESQIKDLEAEKKKLTEQKKSLTSECKKFERTIERQLKRQSQILKKSSGTQRRSK